MILRASNEVLFIIFKPIFGLTLVISFVIIKVRLMTYFYCLNYEYDYYLAGPILL